MVCCDYGCCVCYWRADGLLIASSSPHPLSSSIHKAWYAAAANKPTALRILLRHGADPMAFVLEAGNRHRSIFDVAMCVQLIW